MSTAKKPLSQSSVSQGQTQSGRASEASTTGAGSKNPITIPVLDRQYVHLEDDLWTPLTDEVIGLIEMAKERSGMSWDLFARTSGHRARILRRYRTRHPETKKTRRRNAIPLRVLDKYLTLGGLQAQIRELPWYTPEQMVEHGHWQPMVDLGEYARRMREAL
jgi:hypothetical protein